MLPRGLDINVLFQDLPEEITGECTVWKGSAVSCRYNITHKDKIRNRIFRETGTSNIERVQDETCKTLPGRLKETWGCR